jgi:hypothetical protein
VCCKTGVAAFAPCILLSRAQNTTLAAVAHMYSHTLTFLSPFFTSFTHMQSEKMLHMECLLKFTATLVELWHFTPALLFATVIIMIILLVGPLAAKKTMLCFNFALI